MSMRKLLMMVLAASLVLLCVAGSAVACTGKKVVIGRTAAPQQEMLARLLMILIDKRTGTTVNEVVYETPEAAHAALLKGDVDLGLEYTGVIQVATLGQTPISDAAELYTAVRKSYGSDQNLLVLRPLGFDNRELAPAQSANQGVVILRRDTWKKFPALDRLIEKLSGVVDDSAIKQLEADAAASGDARKVASEFLRARGLY